MMHPMSRRQFVRKTAETAASLTGMEFLSYFLGNGLPHEAKAEAMLRDRAKEADNPHFLLYWFLEGGWESYDMFSPVMTPNNVLHRLDNISLERYRVLHFGEPGYGIYKQGNIRYGYLAEGLKGLFPDMAVLSSMETGEFHSGDRLKAHMGHYNFALQADREDDERSVTQAFAEVYGQPYLLPNLSWHYWLSDGELNEQQYTGRKGYYAALGPAWAHTLYAGTPANLRELLMRVQAASTDPVNRQINAFLDDVNSHLRRDAGLEVVKSYASARDVYCKLNTAGRGLDRAMLSRLFTDPVLRERFKVKPSDELITYTSVNGNKARSKFSPNTNVQAMMTYELMRAGLSCAFWIESRDIRRFDSHYSRRALWGSDYRTPIGQPDQTAMMRDNLWEPLCTLVELLKSTPYVPPGQVQNPKSSQESNRAGAGSTHAVIQNGKSLFDYTTIVLTSEFGRTIHGDVEAIKAMKISDADKQKMIDGQDISQHWKVTGAAFLGGKVKGNSQYGSVGEKTLLAIPLLPDGTMDPAFHPVTGELLPGRKPSDRARIPDHGDVYATALSLCDIDPKGHGRNERPPLTFIKKAG
jgi:hypothetical protein